MTATPVARLASLGARDYLYDPFRQARQRSRNNGRELFLAVPSAEER